MFSFFNTPTHHQVHKKSYNLPIVGGNDKKKYTWVTKV